MNTARPTTTARPVRSTILPRRTSHTEASPVPPAIANVPDSAARADGIAEGAVRESGR